MTCDILTVPERDQHVVLFTAEPGTPAHDALRLLSVIGLQHMSSTPATVRNLDTEPGSS